MNTGVVIALAVGGSLVFIAGIVVLVVWAIRSSNAAMQAVLERLKEELPRRGWTYEERNDSYVSVFNALREEMRQPLLQMPTWRNQTAPFEPYHLPPKAVAARHIITGTHRGRPFIAALFEVKYAGATNTNMAIWVRTPAWGPALTVDREPRLQNRVRIAMGQHGMSSGNVEFDDQFEITEQDERFARVVLNPAVIQYMLTVEPRYLRSMSLLGDHLDLGDQISDHRDPAELIPALDRRCDLLDRIPPSAWS